MAEYTLTKLSDELTLSAGLYQHGQKLFNGLSNHDERRDKARHVIKEFALANEMWMGKTYRQWFVRCYAQEL